MVRTLNSHGLINPATGGFEPISTYVGEKLGFHNVSNQFVSIRITVLQDIILINGEKIQNINLWKNYQRKRIRFF